MAVPELVVASAPFTAYPGGVIVLRATDWLGAARGTLSTETDTRAITGECVRDTQTVANSLFSDSTGAFQAADDTLEIDVSLLPVLVGMTYHVWFSLLIEGDWDVTDSDTFQGSTQHAFSYACAVGWYGTPSHPSDATSAFVTYLPRDRPHYTINSSSITDDLVGDEVIRVRAYSKAGTTTEFLIDQVFLVPYVVSGTHAGWTNSDFEAVGGQANTFGDIGYDPPETGTGFVDGADGGDLNGKFTWSPVPHETPITMVSTEGGGDYQKSTDDEYMIRVVPGDGYFIENSQSGTEAAVTAYSVHGSNFRPAKTWVSDDFSRTVAAGTGNGTWGTGPQGFGWWTTTLDGLMGVDGARGYMQSDNLTGNSGGAAGLSPFPGGVQAAAAVNAPNYTVSGKLEVPGSVPGASFAYALVSLIGRAPSYPDFELVFDILADTWTIESGGGNIFHGPTATPATTIGWKLEIRRHRLMVKVWDSSGAEPGAWDYDDFPPNGPDNYPYGDDLDKSTEFVAFYPILEFRVGAANPDVTVYWDDVLVDYDPYGDPGDMTATIEQPNGTQIGSLDIPYGAWQMIHWGTRDWTELDFGSPYLSFSGKVWNEAGVAELQRAEALLWWFRSTRGGIIPMNWRSSERPGSVRRVLVGDR